MADDEYRAHSRARGRSRAPRQPPQQVRRPRVEEQQNPNGQGRGQPQSYESAKRPKLGYGDSGSYKRQQQPTPSTSGGGDRSVARKQPSSSQQGEKSFNPIWPAKGFVKQGTIGKPVRLCSNFFEVKSNPQMQWQQYHVTFTPEIDNVFIKRAMIHSHKEILGHPLIFDGMVLWSLIKQPKEVTVLFSVRKTDNAEVKIEVKYIHDVSTRDVVALQILNNQMNKNFRHMGFKRVGRHYYDVQDSRSIPAHKLELIPGFKTAIQQFEMRVLMNCESCFKIIRQDDVLTIMKRLQNDNHNFKQACDGALLGESVLTTYNNRTYRIDEIAWDTNPTDTFPKKVGSDIINMTYLDYMKNTWNITIKDVKQPMLLSKPKIKELRRGENRPILLIPELCRLTNLDNKTREDFNVMREVGDHTRLDPTKKVAELNTFSTRFRTNEQVKKEMKSWGLSLASNLQEIQGRCFGPEAIIMTCDEKDRGVQYEQQKSEWSKIIRNKRLLEPMRLANWLLICLGREQNYAEEFIGSLQTVCGPMDISVSKPMIAVVSDDRTMTFRQTLANYISEQLQLVVVIVPSNAKDRYDAIKRSCCLEYGIPSQVILTKTLKNQRTIMSVATKIAIQMNCKLGGQAWRVNIQLPNTMIVGIDTYRDSVQKNKFVCGVVSSTNDYMTKYHSQVSFQDGSESLATQITLGLKRNAECNEKLPSTIIIYRDGVGDGQINQVREMEVSQIIEGLEAQGPNYNPEIIFVIVNKTPGARFFKPYGDAGSSGSSLSSGGYSARPSPVTPSGYGARPGTSGGYGARPGAASGGYGARPGAASGGYGARPAASGGYGARPAAPGGYGARPGAASGGYGVRPGGYGARPGDPGGYGARPGASGGYGARPGPSSSDPRPSRPISFSPQSGRYENAEAGTVIDSEVTRPDRFDFYLISQSVNQGTVSPTYYNIIHTTSNLSVSRLQRLTYQLCHLYYNWQGTVRVPAPTQYAHKLAFLVGQSLHDVPSSRLADTLFYL